MKAWEYGKLRVSDNRKYLCNGDRPLSLIHIFLEKNVKKMQKV